LITGDIVIFIRTRSHLLCPSHKEKRYLQGRRGMCHCLLILTGLVVRTLLK